MKRVRMHIRLLLPFLSLFFFSVFILASFCGRCVARRSMKSGGVFVL